MGAASGAEAVSLVDDRGVEDPITGEVVALDAPVEDLARAFDHLRDLENMAKAARKVLTEELLTRMDRAARWTMREGDFEVQGTSPTVVGYDLERLRAELNGMVAEGLISAEARDACLQAKVSTSVKKAGVTALLKLGGDVAERIAIAEQPMARRVTVKVKEPAA